MGERPYVCSNGHALANRVTTCPMCGAPGKPVRPSIWSVFAVGLLLLAVAGIGITLVGRDGSSSADDTAAPTSTSASTVVLDATATTTTTTEAPATTTTTPATTTTTAPTTTTSTTPTPSSTTPPPAITPTVPRPQPVTPPPTAPPTTQPFLDGRAQQALAQQALVVAYSTGHRPAGYPAVETLIAPDLRRRLGSLTVGDGYRQAGCRQRVSDVRPATVVGSSYGFSFTLERTCDRVPRVNGYLLPLETGAYATIVMSPTSGGSYWAISLQPS